MFYFCHLTREKSTILTNFVIPPIPGFGIGENGRDSGSRDCNCYLQLDGRPKSNFV